MLNVRSFPQSLSVATLCLSLSACGLSTEGTATDLDPENTGGDSGDSGGGASGNSGQSGSPGVSGEGGTAAGGAAGDGGAGAAAGDGGATGGTGTGTGATGGTGTGATGGTGTGATGGTGTGATGGTGTGATGGTGTGGSGGTPPATCPGGTTKWDGNGHCYWRVDTKDHWEDSADRCATAAGYLATIHSQEENDFVEDLVKDNSWIGGTDWKSEKDDGAGTYEWVTSEAWSYDNWDNGEPNSGWVWPCGGVEACYEHCAIIQKNGKWDDKACGARDYESICELEL